MKLRANTDDIVLFRCLESCGFLMFHLKLSEVKHLFSLTHVQASTQKQLLQKELV